MKWYSVTDEVHTIEVRMSESVFRHRGRGEGINPSEQAPPPAVVQPTPTM